jgi:NDP-sugar pyrophosphorylase family protein
MSGDKDGKPLKGLVLAAGLGTRLRPLTVSMPKPLATVCGTTLLDAAIAKLLNAGVKSLAVNSFHLPAKLQAHLTNSSEKTFGINIHVSLEAPVILGTGGAFLPLRSWWGDSPMLVYNGDILSDMNLSKLVAEHKKSKPLVTLAVRKTPPTDGGLSAWVDDHNHLKIFCLKKDLPAKYNGLREFGYACAYVVEPSIFRYLPTSLVESSSIVAFNKALENNEIIKAVEFDGLWADIGTPKSLWETNLKVAAMSENNRADLLGKAYNPRQCKLLENNVLGSGNWRADPSLLSGCVFLGDASALPGEKLQNHLRGFGFDHAFLDVQAEKPS